MFITQHQIILAYNKITPRIGTRAWTRARVIPKQEMLGANPKERAKKGVTQLLIASNNVSCLRYT